MSAIVHPIRKLNNNFIYNMASGRYWRIHYGPDHIDDEAFCVVIIINKTLRKLVQKIDGVSIGRKAHADKAPSCEGGLETYYVTALLDVGVDVTESQLLEHLLTECGDAHTGVIEQCCRLEALSALEYSHLV